MDRRRVFELLEAALKVPPDARPAALEELCGGDAVLRRRLETLLALEPEAGEYLTESVIADPAELEAGSLLGPYRHRSDVRRRLRHADRSLRSPVGHGRR